MLPALKIATPLFACAAALVLCQPIADAAQRRASGSVMSERMPSSVRLAAAGGAQRTLVKRPQSQIGRPGQRPPSRGDDVATSDKPRPGHDRPDRKPRRRNDDTPDTPKTVSCQGGRVVKGDCVCPRGARSVSRAGTTTCIDVAHRPDPRPSNPSAPVATGTPQHPPSLPPTASTPPPPRDPQRPAAPLTRTPFVPTPALADAVVVPDEMLVAVAASAPESAESNWARRLNLDILERTTLVALGQRIVRCRIPDGRTVASVVAAARRDANERRGIAVDPQPNYLYRPQQDASRPAPSSLQYALAKMDLDRAHHSAIGRGVVVGVIDTGIDLDHADLRNSDILALDATGAAAAAEPHGTAIAGIIAARGTTQGIAPMARILSVRAFAKTTNGTPQLATTFIVLKALDIAVRNEARVLNLSFAGPADPMLGKAIAFASKSGVIMVAAAGNNGRKAPPVYPAAYPSVIAATAVDADDRLYTKANIGKYVTIAAPGVDVLATAPGGAHALHSGTSFAAAHVTGIVALLMEQRPGLSADEVRRALIASATDLGSPGIDDEFGAGRVSAAAALDALKPSAPR